MSAISELYLFLIIASVAAVLIIPIAFVEGNDDDISKFQLYKFPDSPRRQQGHEPNDITRPVHRTRTVGRRRKLRKPARVRVAFAKTTKVTSGSRAVRKRIDYPSAKN